MQAPRGPTIPQKKYHVSSPQISPYILTIRWKTCEKPMVFSCFPQMPGRPPSSHFSAVISIDSNSCWRSPSASAWQSRNLVASSIHNKWTTWHAFHVFPRIMLYNVIYVCIYICIVHPEIRKSNAMFRDSLFAPHSWGSGRPRLTHGAAAQAVHSTHKLRRDVCEKMYLWLCQNSYWKWPFIVSFPINSMVIFHSYVNDYQRVTCKKSSKRPAKTSSCPLFLGFWMFLGRLLPVLLPIRQGSGFSHGTLCDTHINISQGMPCHSSLKHGNNNKKCHVTFATPRLPHFMTWIKTAAGELDQKKKWNHVHQYWLW